MKKAVRAIAATMACTMAFGFFAACGGQKEVYDNENDPLILSTLALDKVFNPFFSTSATDTTIAGMTQISMLSNTKDGNPAYGDTEAVVVKDLQIETTGTGENQTTEYKFVLKNNVRFSNGTYLTIKDVLFNLYVYLDPVYTGASTIYSSDIVGLAEYRTQTADKNEQDAFMKDYQTKAQNRIDALLEAFDLIKEESNNAMPGADAFKTRLQAIQTAASVANSQNLVDDYEKTLEFFREELDDDFSAARDGYDDVIFTDKSGQKHEHLLKSDVENFLYNEGEITWSKADAQLTCNFGDLETVRGWTEEQAKQAVFDKNIPDKLDEILQYWVTADTLYTYLTNDEMEKDNSATREFKNISGIKFLNRTEPCEVNDVTYDVPTYADNTNSQVISGNEVLSITIHKIDPKAIWNFAFAVAPMYYYSDAEHIAKFDYEENFGVEYRSQSFMSDVVNATSKVGVPVGAGAYAASRSSGALKEDGTIEVVGAGDFYSLGIVYFERNPFFVLGPAKIKNLRYSVVTDSQMVNSLYTHKIDYIEPNAKPETIRDLNSKKDEGIGSERVQTSGYGYIGINAGKVPNLYVRRAIMHTINTQTTVDYYGTTAKPIYRSMSLSSWVYELALKDITYPYYPYIGGPIPEDPDKLGDESMVDPDYVDYLKDLQKTNPNVKKGYVLTEEEQHDFIRYLVEELGGYSPNGDGVYQSGNDVLNYRFTVVGDTEDHPAFQAFWEAYEKLNKWGFNVEVKTDHDGLLKLSTGDLAVWAAAWTSTIDPDMYQVYHKDSTATSVLNWGYRQILRNQNRYKTEYDIIVNELAPKIEHAREFDDSTAEGKKSRAEVYREALDLVMQLAVELPTYQRDDLFAYNTNKIDESSLTPNSELSAFKGLLYDIQLVSLVVAQ